MLYMYFLKGYIILEDVLKKKDVDCFGCYLMYVVDWKFIFSFWEVCIVLVVG